MLWRHVQLTDSPLPPPPIASSMHKQAYTPGRNHLLQLSSCPDQCLVKGKCPSSGEAGAVVVGRWPVSHLSSEVGKGGSVHWGPDVMTPAWGWKGGPGLTYYFSLICLVICSHLPTDHTLCAMHYCRCWEAPWGIILDKTASVWSQSVFTWDHSHSQIWELLLLDIWPLQTEAGGMPWREILQ